MLFHGQHLFLSNRDDRISGVREPRLRCTSPALALEAASVPVTFNILGSSGLKLNLTLFSAQVCTGKLCESISSHQSIDSMKCLFIFSLFFVMLDRTQGFAMLGEHSITELHPVQNAEFACWFSTGYFHYLLKTQKAWRFNHKTSHIYLLGKYLLDSTLTDTQIFKLPHVWEPPVLDSSSLTAHELCSLVRWSRPLPTSAMRRIRWYVLNMHSGNLQFPLELFGQ